MINTATHVYVPTTNTQNTANTPKSVQVLWASEEIAAIRRPTNAAVKRATAKARTAIRAAMRRLVSGRAIVRSHRSHLCGSLTM